jgi:nucleotide-binding universal stress UspA family protein
MAVRGELPALMTWRAACNLEQRKANPMLQVRKILFPVDFSERSTAAAAHVVTMAEHFDAQVTLLNVFHVPPVWYGDLATAELEAWVGVDELVKERQQTLESYLKSDLQNVKHVERIVEKGDPAGVITAYARKEGVDLIMMATHGYGPFRRFLLGSVTAKVLHDAACPVWTDVHEVDAFPRSGCQTVLCAVDLRPESIISMQWAADFASAYGAELILIHAIPSIAEPSAPEGPRFRAYLIQNAREIIADLQMKAGTNARVCVDGGKIAESVRNAALQHGADLVVIGQGCMHKVLGRLRTNAYAIVRESPCPVVRI